MSRPLDNFRERLRNQSSEEEILNTTFRRVGTVITPTVETVKAVEATKPKEPKPMSNRHTRNNTGWENYSDSQLAAGLDSANTQPEIARCVQEMQNRLSKYRETVGHMYLEYKSRQEVEYQKYHQNGGPGFQYEEKPEPEPAPPPPPVSLTWDKIEAIEFDICDYGPYIREIYESDWDYIDRRPNNVHMRADQYMAKDWAETHKDDIGTISSLSVSQHGLMMVMLKAYLFHKKHPECQAQANAPPF